MLGVASALAQAGVDLVSPPPIYDEESIGERPAVSDIQPITDVVPLWGTELRKDGVDLPLPFGLGLTYTFIDQNTQVYDVQVQGRSVGAGAFRADAWLLPFLNVYGLLGDTAGKTKPVIRLPSGESIGDTIDYSRAM